MLHRHPLDYRTSGRISPVARPWERPLGHQLKRAVIRDFVRRQWRHLQCALIECQKNKVVTRCSFSALASKQILETLFAPPRRRKKRRRREEITEKNQTGPKNTDRCEDQKPIATKPMHARIIPLLRDFEISFQRDGPPLNH